MVSREMQPIVFKDIEVTDNQKPSYRFRGADGQCHWPKRDGHGLGAAGMWNFLWRVGYHPELLALEQLPQDANNRLIFIDKTCPLDPLLYARLKTWIQNGGKIIATGSKEAWKDFLPQYESWQQTYSQNPYAGIGYNIHQDNISLIAPAGWSFLKKLDHTNIDDSCGKIVTISGERQTPQRATITQYDEAPIIIANGAFYYLNAQPFAALQAWLQGQEDLSPWIHWRHRLFWLDEWVSDLCELLIQQQILNQEVPRDGITTLGKTTIVIRHDLDYSRDKTFLEEENKRMMPASYAILKDKNAAFWTQQLQNHTLHEAAFHYNTGRRSLGALVHRAITGKTRPGFVPTYRQIQRNGLLKQVRWAKQHGIEANTLHRHLSYIIYPEIIDALDHVFENEPDILGSSSFFRGQLLKWGNNRVDGMLSYHGDWPDSQFPFMYPYKLGHAAKGGKILQKWEITSFMDVEPDMLSRMLSHQIKHIKQSVFVLNFHPAHAQQDSLYLGGSKQYFYDVLDILEQKKIQVMTMRDVFKHATKVSA